MKRPDNPTSIYHLCTIEIAIYVLFLGKQHGDNYLVPVREKNAHGNREQGYVQKVIDLAGNINELLYL